MMLYISQIHPVQLYVTYVTIEKETVRFRKKIKNNVINVSLLKLGNMRDAYSILSKEQLMYAAIGGDIGYDPVIKF